MTPSKETRRAEGRDQPEGIPRGGRRVRTQSRVAVPANLARVNAAARRAVQTRFTALLHHVDIAALEQAFRRQKQRASAGVDGITVTEYEQNLEANLQDLCARVHTGRSRYGVSTSQRRMGVSAHSACRPWTTKSSRAPS